MWSHARVVVIGGGNMGAGVLYHLAKEGWTDCVLLEKAELTSGATWHAAGLVSRMVGGHALGCIHDTAVDLYKSIEAETDQAVSWHGCGSLRVATSDHHVDWIKHLYDCILARGQEAHIVGPEEIGRLNPLYDLATAGIRCGLFTPDDGHVDPAGTCQAMAKGARLAGAEVVRRCRVTGVRALPSGEWEVTSDRGTIRCEHLVNAGGYHARQIGAWSGLDLPITPMQHHYVVTDDVPDFDAMAHEIPVTRDDFFCGYLRREQRSALIGLYDTQAPKAKWRDGCPWESEHELFEPDLEAITPWLERCFERFPALLERGIKRIVNGAITYTPDGAMLLGPAPGLRNHWLACGATVGIAWGPGAGRALAQLIVHGAADISTRAFDPRRFGTWADSSFAHDRAREDYRIRVQLPVPQRQYRSCRDIRRSGAHDRTLELGAIHEEAGGWERPRLYAPAAFAGAEPEGWRRTDAFATVRAEGRAVHERVGLGDFSAFAKFEITGPEATDFLERVCANRLPRRVGGSVLTLHLNPAGRIEGEATVARLGDTRYWFVTGAPSERRLWDWLTLHQRGSEEVAVINRSDEVGILTLAGPKARAVLAALTDADLSNSGFSWLQAREITVAGIELIALRLSFTGEQAWELHAPNDRLGALWDALWQAGQSHGIAAFGAAAMNGLRLEKAYRGGHELTNDATPRQVGMMRFVKQERSFIGSDAVARHAEAGSLLVALEVDAADADCSGGEAVYADGRLIGSVSSGGYGPVTDKSLALAFVKPEVAAPGARLQVSLFGDLRQARVLGAPVRDPDNSRLKVEEGAYV